ncbi:MAG: response regulator [Polyangiaceae bacterium]
MIRSDIGARILLADDDEDLRWLIADRLRADGHTVIEVSSGAELMDFIRKVVADHPDVIVSDVLMPGFDGIEVLGALRMAEWSVPVVLMTALRDRDVRDAANRLGALALFEKPFDLHELRTVLLDVTRRA